MKPLLFTLCLMALMVSHTPRAVAAENNPDEILEFLTRFYSDEVFQQEHVQYPLLNVATVKPSDITDRPYAVYWASEEFNCILNRAEDYFFEYVKLSENAIRVHVNLSFAIICTKNSRFVA